MHIVIGGACAGKRNAVAEQYSPARWVCATELARTGSASQGLLNEPSSAGRALVVSGWLDEIARRIAHEASDDRLRATLADNLDELVATGRQQGIDVVVIISEVGRGIVPLALEERRLRDLAGWFAQDAVIRASRLWYVRHGLVRELAPRIDLPRPSC